MLGIIFLYFIGKYFYELAHEHNRNRWGFAILGIAVYYACTALMGVFFALSDEFLSTKILEMSDLEMGLLAMPFGFLGAWGFYRILKNKWSKTSSITDSDVLDDQFTN